MTRILHFSDVHLEDGFEGVPLREMLSKRLVGLANLRLHRGPYFHEARTKVEALAALAERERVDVALCTGDSTALGTERELAYARTILEPFTSRPKGFVMVPGNHDVYVDDAVSVARFERHFGDLLGTDAPDLVMDGTWPIVRFPCDRVAIVGLNSARANAVHISSGCIPEAQMAGLVRALRDPRLAGRFVFVATHYAPRLWNGRPDRPTHGLENADELLETCRHLDGAIVFGHIHHNYHVRLPDVSPSLFCAGSATHRGREGAWIYDVSDAEVVATPLGWTGRDYERDPTRTVVVPRADRSRRELDTM